MPLSEALAARRQADHPWWHKTKARIPPALQARWTLSTTAVAALALLAITGAALGGWYLTRSQATVVDVGGAAGSGSGGVDGSVGGGVGGGGGASGSVGGGVGGSVGGGVGVASSASGTVGEGGGGGNAGEANAGLEGHRGGRLGEGAAAAGGDAAARGDAAAGGLLGQRPGTAADGACPARPATVATPRALRLGSGGSLGVAHARALGTASGGRLGAAHAGLLGQKAGGSLQSPAHVLSAMEVAPRYDPQLLLPVGGSSRSGAHLLLIAAPRYDAHVLLAVGGSSRYAGRVLPVPESLRGHAGQVELQAIGGWLRTPNIQALMLVSPDSLRSAAESRRRLASGGSLALRMASGWPVVRGALGTATEASPALTTSGPRHSVALRTAATNPAVPPTSATCLPRAGANSANAASSGAIVVVDVEGKVVRPGVQALPVGARVYEALAAAGGALAGVDVTALDLARPVADGEQLRVGIAGEPAPVVGVAGAGGVKGKRKGGRVVNLNAATVEELQAVPGVGPAMAQRILEWRAAHGRFASVGQLRQVRGIGERKFADMRDSVTV